MNSFKFYLRIYVHAKTLKRILKKLKTELGNVKNYCIFTSVFHRILDFKNGAEFLFWPLFFYSRSGCSSSLK